MDATKQARMMELARRTQDGTATENDKRVLAELVLEMQPPPREHDWSHGAGPVIVQWTTVGRKTRLDEAWRMTGSPASIFMWDEEGPARENAESGGHDLVKLTLRLERAERID